jgi:hypothetical protein
MTESAMPSTTDVLLDILKRAEAAHGEHEKETGQADPDWPEWYAAHMTRSLKEQGYRLVKA